MAVAQLKDGRWIVAYRRGTIPEAPNRTRKYFGRGIAGSQAAEQRNTELGFGRRKPQQKKKDRRDVHKYISNFFGKVNYC